MAPEDAAPRWHRGDRVEVRDGDTSTWMGGVVRHPLPDGGARVAFGKEIIEVKSASRLRAPADVFPRCAAAASAALRAHLIEKAGSQGSASARRAALVAAFRDADADGSGALDEREFLDCLKDAGLRVDLGRACGGVAVEVSRASVPRARKAHDLDQPAPRVLVARRGAGELRAGDEVLGVDGRAVADEAARLVGSETEDASQLAASLLAQQAGGPGDAWWRVRRTTCACLSKRELDALKRAVGLGPKGCTIEALAAFAFDDAPVNGEPELAVAMAVAANFLRAARDPKAAFAAVCDACGGKETTIDASKLQSHLTSTKLHLPCAGFGLGGPDDDGFGETTNRALSPQQAHTIVRRCLDVSGDGVVALDEFTAFAFWPNRSADDLRRAVRAAAYSLPAGDDPTPGRRLMRALDRDGNGLLGKAELVGGLARIGCRLLPDEQATLINALDSNGDGVTGRAELLAFFGEKPAKDDPSAKTRTPTVPRVPTAKQRVVELVAAVDEAPRPDADAPVRAALASGSPGGGTLFAVPFRCFVRNVERAWS